MNDAAKIVFSRTLASADWKNTTIVKEDAVEAVKRIKESSAKDLTVLGSGSLLRQFSEHGLVDELRLMIYPAMAGTGDRLFRQAGDQQPMRLIDTHTHADHFSAAKSLAERMRRRW